ncbi:hypothetical protein Bbelb_439320 [Branchiostoma belcheri]|nr:hypothetical protein Bbelb_439320 [Branchiostoma belcheri]
MTIDYLQKGQTINGVYCGPELRHLRATITEKRGEKLRLDVLSMHLSTQHRAPWAFYLFPKLEFHLRGQRFDGDDGVIDVVQAFLRASDEIFFYKRKESWNINGPSALKLEETMLKNSCVCVFGILTRVVPYRPADLSSVTSPDTPFSPSTSPLKR